MNFTPIENPEPIIINGVEITPDEGYLVENFMIDQDEETSNYLSDGVSMWPVLDDAEVDYLEMKAELSYGI
tara:strand:+ start:592 stop:804 length:213 start_codon:yes stop_codon:yes gene_type:complete